MKNPNTEYRIQDAVYSRQIHQTPNTKYKTQKNRHMFSIEDYHYHLPEHLIAQQPMQERDHSRLLVMDRNTGSLSHQVFHELETFLEPSDVLVVNNTRVIPGRLVGEKKSGGRIEALILNYASGLRSSADGNQFDCMLKSSKRTRIGTRLYFSEGVTAQVMERADNIYRLSFSCEGDFPSVLNRIGQTPLPPYIKRDGAQSTRDDRATYQTIYASQKGAIAAPTAGFHFTEALMRRLKDKGVTLAPITLHIGYGTFSPVRVTDIRAHRMHSEWFSIPEETAESVSRAKREGRRVVAVGTTSVRTLEFAMQENGNMRPMSGACDLFIYPGYRFRVVDAMITNFHLPKSTLLMLVSAFAGRNNILAAYHTAIQENYRFYSYGDAMLIY
jgi:S-adenosylmethionine:tRNA ribosyltransferase-isomerase